MSGNQEEESSEVDQRGKTDHLHLEVLRKTENGGEEQTREQLGDQELKVQQGHQYGDGDGFSEQGPGFSRRKSYDSRTDVSSVYNDESKPVPAWMKSRRSDKHDKYEKYDKYGGPAVAVTPAATLLNRQDDRYNKYMKSEVIRTEERIRRNESRSPPHDQDRNDRNDRIDRKRKFVDEEVPKPAPYTNLSVSLANGSGDNYQTFQSRIYDKENKDINSIVRTHYNQRTKQSKYQGSRTKSPIYKLRNFNNTIKYILLGNWVKKNPEGRPTVFLDLCCGKGGDLNKCEFVSIDQYIGIDISDESIKEAFSRYSRNKARFVPQNTSGYPRDKDTRKYNFEACFATGDCFGTTVPEILEPNFPGIVQTLFPVDCVSVQFSLHYAFETRQKVETLINNVAKSLRPGGTFIGTIPSSDFIRDKIVNQAFLDQSNLKFGNDLYSVSFRDPPPPDGIFRSPYGNVYNYSLRDAIDDVPEYVVPFESLRAVCEDHGLTLKYKKNFIDIFNLEIPKYFSRLNKNLMEGMKRSDGKYGAEGSEKEAVGFYIGFVFEKLGS